MALYKLYRATGDKKYFDLAKFFIDERGNPERIADRVTPPEHDPNAGTSWRWRHPSYMQDHLPVHKQYEAKGHAVRAGYMYCAMADIVMETGDKKYLPSLDSIWNETVRKKMYITGGIGTREFHDEGFGSDYRLPNDQAYCETCSGIALTFWNRRMNLLHANAKYADLVELSMFNSVIAGVSLSGDRFFYTNPLESTGDHERTVWENPPCCPTNMVRFLPEIGSTIYGHTSDAVYINQFIASKTTIGLTETKIAFNMGTNYPWEGEIKINVEPEAAMEFRLNIRIPSWARGNLLPTDLYGYLNNDKTKDVVIKVNGETVEKPGLVNGYVVINKTWKMGDFVELILPMDVKYVTGNPKIEDTRDKVVLSCGPLIYCLEGIDNDAYFDENNESFVLPNSFQPEHDENLLNGVVKLKGSASLNGGEEKISVTAVPYYTWNNRGQGQMKVWLPFIKNDR